MRAFQLAQTLFETKAAKPKLIWRFYNTPTLRQNATTEESSVVQQEGRLKELKQTLMLALVAMTLMIAESPPQEKAVITAMFTNLIASAR